MKHTTNSLRARETKFSFMKKERLPWSTVKIISGSHKGRIGNYDDDTLDDKHAIVYFGSPMYMSEYHLLSHKHFAPTTIDDLMTRHGEILKTLKGRAKVSVSKQAELFAELSLIDNELAERMFTARLTAGETKKVFISHSSKDKEFVRWLAVDLANAGHPPWLDEWKIRVGESIPTKVSQGIQTCDAMVVVLSEHAVTSKWVENEWQAKYWEEIVEGQIKVLPVLARQCEIPTLLKTKKYANFTQSYNEGLESLLIALQS